METELPLLLCYVCPDFPGITYSVKLLARLLSAKLILYNFVYAPQAIYY